MPDKKIEDVVFFISSTEYGIKAATCALFLRSFIDFEGSSHMTPEYRRFSRLKALSFKIVQMEDKSAVQVVGEGSE